MTVIVTLRSGALRLDLAPAIGGAISRFASEGPDGAIEWMRPMSGAAIAAGDVLGSSCFPLVPYSNRIRDNAFAFDGRHVRMEHPYAHALHGHGWLAPWQVEGAAADRASLVFARNATPDWPFAYRARQDFILAGGRLDMRIEIVNAGDRRMPAGFGLHPYFPRTPPSPASGRPMTRSCPPASSRRRRRAIRASVWRSTRCRSTIVSPGGAVMRRSSGPRPRRRSP